MSDMDTPFETEEREDGIFKFKIKWYADYDADLSWLGGFASRPEGKWYVDRKTGKLHGTDGKWVEVVEDGEVVEEWQGETYDTRTNDYERGDYQYWIPGGNHNPPGREESWSRVSEEARQEEFKKYNVTTIRDVDIQYMLRDHELYEDIAHNRVGVCGYVVECYVDDVEVSVDSQWGIIGGRVNDAYHQQCVTESLAVCKADAIASLSRTIEIVEARLSTYQSTLETLRSFQKENDAKN